jgi:transposase
MKLSYEEGLDKGEANAENRILAIIQDLKSGMSEIDIAKKHQVEVSVVKKFR